MKKFGQHTILIAQTPVEAKLKLAVLPGVDDDLITDSNSMRNRLGIDVLATLKGENGEGIQEGNVSR